MCARRFLLIIFILTLLAVAGAFAVFQYGQQVLVRQATPAGRFTPPPADSAPDYRLASTWLARPGLSDNPANWTPEGWVEPRHQVPQTAVFYIHPTTYLNGDRWNASLAGDADSAYRTRLFVQSQASAFNGNAEIWAPRYRQAAYGAFLLNSRDSAQSLDLAYRDVLAAFDHFVAAQPKDRRVALAGHSQGALHLIRLLRERQRQLKDRLVAAYVVGWPISTAADLPQLGFPACRSPAQTGCILSWMSFKTPANPALILDSWSQTKGLNGAERKQADVLCVNPLTGSTGATSAAPAANLGTLVPTSDLRSARVVTQQVGARCEDGLLFLEGKVPNLGPFVLPGNNYHVYDFALFWGNIRADFVRRAAAGVPRP